MPKTVYKTGGKQTINIHIHEKSKEKKRRQRRKKVSGSGAIRTINRMIPATSELPQRRLMTQQLIVLPEGDKALGQIGMKPQNVLTYQRELIRQQIKEYEDEVKGLSLKERDKPVVNFIDLTGDEPPTVKSDVKISKIKELKDVKIETVLANRRDEAIEYYGISKELKDRKKQNKQIRQAHKDEIENLPIKKEVE
jgi:hypothetical protein